MPVKSKSQWRMIQATKSKYKSEAKTPESKKWVWKGEWFAGVNYDSLPETVSEDITQKEILKVIIREIIRGYKKIKPVKFRKATKPTKPSKFRRILKPLKLKPLLKEELDDFITEDYPDLVGTYSWNNGLNPNDANSATRILDALNKRFGSVKYNKKNGKIEFEENISLKLSNILKDEIFKSDKRGDIGEPGSDPGNLVGGKKVKMTLDGANKNAFNILASFKSNAKKQGWAEEEIKKVTDECLSGDFDYCLEVLQNHIDTTHPENTFEDNKKNFSFR
jgi:hypothetical protein